MVQATLFEHEVCRDSGPAYFGTLVKRGDRFRHDVHPVEAMPDWLHAVRHSSWDTSISQAQFFAPKRRIATLKTIGLVWADLGDDERLSSLGESAAVHRILKSSDDAGIPAPSIIISSGRGYHAKWLFEKALPSQALPRWNALERTITEKLHDDLDADFQATNAAGLLRVVDTLNTKTGTLAKLVWRNDVNGEPLRYAFDGLCYDVLPRERPGSLTALDKAPKAKRVATGFYNIATLWWGRFRDLKKICELRGWTLHNGGVPKGYRDLMLFLFSTALSWVALPPTWRDEVQAVAEQYTPTLKGYEKRAFVGSVHRRLLESRVPGNKDRRYRFTTARIIQDLGISSREMRDLEMLVSPAIARERDRAKTLERNRSSRAELSEKRAVEKAIRNEKIRRMHNEGANVSLIASKLGISRPTVYAALQGDDLAP